MDIVLHHVSKGYQGEPVLEDVSFAFSKGKHYCIMGSSGLGKTTLLHLLLGLLVPDSGKVEGIDSASLAPVFQEDRLCENVSVKSNLRLVCPTEEKLEPAEEILQGLLLPSVLNVPVHELSGGMKRRVALARAIISGREVMIWDEPFKGLDAETKQVVIAYLRKACRGKTVIWVSHDVSEQALFGGTLVLMGEGGQLRLAEQ